jgi:hypothetical protein
MLGMARWRILVLTGSALAAAVLGAAAQEVLDSRLRLAAAIVVVVGLVAIGTFATLLFIADARGSADQELRSDVRKLADGQRELARTISRSIGLHVDTMLMTELNEAKSVADDRTVQMMLGAERELRILDLLLEDGQWPDVVMNQAYQENAFDTFLQIMNRTENPISYMRIVQVIDPASSLRGARTENLVRHCHEILDVQAGKGHRASLRVTRRRFPFKFILIDDTRLVLQLQEYGGSAEALLIWGEILVTDPGSQLINVFRAIWDEIVDDPTTRTVTVADLPPRPPASRGGDRAGPRPPAADQHRGGHRGAENRQVDQEAHAGEAPLGDRGQRDQGADGKTAVGDP